MKDQPKPIPNDSASMHDLVIEDMKERKQIGLDRYNSLLQINNGRDFLIDLSQELLDGQVYLKGLQIELRELGKWFEVAKEKLGNLLHFQYDQVRTDSTTRELYDDINTILSRYPFIVNK